MLKIKINNEFYRLPTAPDEVSLDIGLNLNYIWSNQEHDLNTKREILNILKPSILWNKIKESQLDEIIENISILKTDELNELELYTCFRNKKIEYGLHKLKVLTVKEYMDVEFYLNYGDGALDNLDKISAILYRPLLFKNKNIKNILFNISSSLLNKNIKPLSFTNYEIESYENHLENSIRFREDFTYSMGLTALYVYSLYKSNLTDEFETLFKVKPDEEDPFAEEEEQYMEDHPDEVGPSFEENWGFYHVFVGLVPTIAEREIWLNKDIKEFLKYITYENIKAIKNEKNNVTYE